MTDQQTLFVYIIFILEDDHVEKPWIAHSFASIVPFAWTNYYCLLLPLWESFIGPIQSAASWNHLA